MGISIWQLLIVLAIIVLLFGTKRLRNIGGDLGNAVKGFKKTMQDDEKDPKAQDDKAELQDSTQHKEDASETEEKPASRSNKDS